MLDSATLASDHRSFKFILVFTPEFSLAERLSPCYLKFRVNSEAWCTELELRWNFRDGSKVDSRLEGGGAHENIGESSRLGPHVEGYPCSLRSLFFLTSCYV